MAGGNDVLGREDGAVQFTLEGLKGDPDLGKAMAHVVKQGGRANTMLQGPQVGFAAWVWLLMGESNLVSLAEASPDVLLFAFCGFGLQRNVKEAHPAMKKPGGWPSLLPLPATAALLLLMVRSLTCQWSAMHKLHRPHYLWWRRNESILSAGPLLADTIEVGLDVVLM